MTGEALCWTSSVADVVQVRGVAEREVRVKRCWCEVKRALGRDDSKDPKR